MPVRRRPRSAAPTVLAVALACLSAASSAGSLFLNGVNVDGLVDQVFEKVTVRIDARGNVFIDAPGYQVKKLAAPVEASPAREGGLGGARVVPVATAIPVGSLTKQYILVTEQSALGVTEYDIDVSINGKLVRTLRSAEEQIVTDVTKHFRPGKNTVLFQARKRLANPTQPKSIASTDVFRVIIGEGVVGAEQVLIENPIVKFERTAADMTDVSREFLVVTQ